MPIGNLDDLVARPDMPGRTTLAQLIRRRPDFPLIERGGRGRAHKIDLDEAAAFVKTVRQTGIDEGLMHPERRRRGIELLGLTIPVDPEFDDG